MAGSSVDGGSAPIGGADDGNSGISICAVDASLSQADNNNITVPNNKLVENLILARFISIHFYLQKSTFVIFPHAANKHTEAQTHHPLAAHTVLYCYHNCKFKIVKQCKFSETRGSE